MTDIDIAICLKSILCFLGKGNTKDITTTAELTSPCVTSPTRRARERGQDDRHQELHELATTTLGPCRCRLIGSRLIAITEVGFPSDELTLSWFQTSSFILIRSSLTKPLFGKQIGNYSAKPK